VAGGAGGRGNGRAGGAARGRGGDRPQVQPPLVQAHGFDQLVAAGCTRLSWALQPDPAAPCSPAWLQVVSLDSITRRVHVVPDPTSKKNGEYTSFYVSAFKYDRLPADKSGLAKE
jgi:hypothetical protein